jgi:hypothetical protein
MKEVESSSKTIKKGMYVVVVLINGLLDNEERDEHLNCFVIYRENCAGYLV